MNFYGGISMTAIATYSPTGNAYVDGVLTGVKWGVTTLTFSFPTDATFYGASYSEAASNFKAFTGVQQAAVRATLSMYSAVSNVSFTEVTETPTSHADPALRRVGCARHRLGLLSEHGGRSAAMSGSTIPSTITTIRSRAPTPS